MTEEPTPTVEEEALSPGARKAARKPRRLALGFVTATMGVGAAALVAVSVLSGQAMRIAEFTPQQWIAAAYLGAGGGALAFFLWVYALQYASPTRVANTMTVNPIAAAVLAALLVGEPITIELVFGLLAVFAGIWLATSDVQKG